jgi:hypothetical protein
MTSIATRMAGRAGLFLLAMVMLTATAPGKQLFDYVDEHGVRHFTDTAPATDSSVRITRIQVDERPLIRLETPGNGSGGSRIVVHNLSAGPIEVGLSFSESQNIATTPSLPGRFVLDTPGEHTVATTASIDRFQPASFRIEATAVPGDPRGRPDPRILYRLPLPGGTRYAIGQGFGGSFSHNDDQNFHAVDIGVDEGTPVVAARDGIVIQVERDFYESGSDKSRLAGRANYVRVMHEDDTMAVYAHLAYESVLVRPGDVVLAGQRIGSAGATGFATGPHLHFVVQHNAGLRLKSIPFQFVGPDGGYTPTRSQGWERAR